MIDGNILETYRSRHNRLVQKLFPSIKIFFVGFNKTATNTFDFAMKRHDINSVHWLEPKISKILAFEIEKRLNDTSSLKNYLEQWTAFSDLSCHTAERWIEGNRHFRTFDRLFPRSYFVLNDRDTNDWIVSRSMHDNGKFLRDACDYHSLSDVEVFALWRETKERHVEDVLEYFRGRRRFLHFRIDRDPPSRLARFLSPTFLIGTENWPHVNKTRHREPTHSTAL